MRVHLSIINHTGFVKFNTINADYTAFYAAHTDFVKRTNKYIFALQKHSLQNQLAK